MQESIFQNDKIFFLNIIKRIKSLIKWGKDEIYPELQFDLIIFLAFLLEKFGKKWHSYTPCINCENNRKMFCEVWRQVDDELYRLSETPNKENNLEELQKYLRDLKIDCRCWTPEIG